MKKISRIFLIFLFILFILFLGEKVQANTINQILMSIYVDNKGDAHITEVWNCNVTKGTEVYHPYYNLGNSKIENLTVTDGNNKYTTLSTWNTSGTLSSKANKCGINKISNGVELCWGISNYGAHKYTVKYTITNFVSELTDSQMIYWTLIPYDFSNRINDVYIKIYTNFKIADTTDVWGYGNYGGTAYVYNGYIEMQPDGALDTDEYMTILVKFPKGTFNTTNKLNKNFNYYYKQAEKGATKYVEGNELTDINLGAFVNIILVFIFSFLLFKGTKKPLHSLNFGYEGKKIPKNVEYFRDIPCDKDIFKAYYIAHQYGLTKNKTDVLGAIILKWLKDGLIKIEKKETAGILKKDDMVVALVETNIEDIKEEKEKDLFKMLNHASKDGYLESKEFEKWCNKSYSKILSWFDDIIRTGRKKLVEDGFICIEEKVMFKKIKHKEYVAQPELKQEAIKLAGLKRYLKDYTLIKDRQAIEVQLFEEYLIFAQILGIANIVAKEFEDLYPEIIEQSNFGSYDNIDFVDRCSSRGISSAKTAKSRAQNYSSGGGGFSSGGGGGGSFGGGEGGGGFR